MYNEVLPGIWHIKISSDWAKENAKTKIFFNIWRFSLIFLAGSLIFFAFTPALIWCKSVQVRKSPHTRNVKVGIINWSKNWLAWLYYWSILEILWFHLSVLDYILKLLTVLSCNAVNKSKACQFHFQLWFWPFPRMTKVDFEIPFQLGPMLENRKFTPKIITPRVKRIKNPCLNTQVPFMATPSWGGQTDTTALPCGR